MFQSQKYSLSNPETWVDQYGDFLYNFAYRRLNSCSLAEDLIQDTFLGALKSRNRYKGNSSERTWLIGILKHKIFDYYRKNLLDDSSPYSKQFFNFSTNDPVAQQLINREHMDEGVSRNVESNPEKSIELKDIFDRIIKALPFLPNKSANAFQMYDIEGIDKETVCLTLNITENNFWVILHRARRKIREILETDIKLS